MTTTNNLLNEVECFFNAHLQQLTSECILKDLNFKFTFKPVLFQQEKRGHIMTSAPLNYIVERNKLIENVAEAYFDTQECISVLCEKLNQLIKTSKDDKSMSVSNKLSHFTQKDGVLSLYLSDKKSIEEIIEFTKNLINSEDDDSDRATDDMDPFTDDLGEGDNEDLKIIENSKVGDSIFENSESELN